MERIVAHGLRLAEHVTGCRHLIQAVLLGSIAGAAVSRYELLCDADQAEGAVRRPGS
jgi:hypothetical protein